MADPVTKEGKEQQTPDILGACRTFAKEPYQSLQNWKTQRDRKIIACMPMQIPEEIIHAAGVLPVIIPESKEPVTIAVKHIQNFFCGYARNVIDVTLKGKLDFLDGMVFQDTCHTMRPMFDIINANHPFDFMRRIFMPLALAKPQAKPFLLGELKRFRSEVEKFTGREITDDALQNSILVYNENKKLMRSLYDLRRKRPEIMTSGEMIGVNVANMLMPKEDHSELLKKLIPALDGRKVFTNGENRTRLVMTGSLCEAPSDELFNLTEEMGGIIVDDDLYTGSRYFLTETPDCADPIEGLADAYLHMISPCPTRIYQKLELGPYLVNMIKKADAKGLIIVMVKFCEAHDYTYPHMRRHLDKAGIPYLMIKTEHESTPIEQIKTRLQAFLEIVKGT